MSNLQYYLNGKVELFVLQNFCTGRKEEYLVLCVQSGSCGMAKNSTIESRLTRLAPVRVEE